MKNSKKSMKLLAFLTALAMLSTFFTACKEEPEPPPPPPQGTDSTPQGIDSTPVINICANGCEGGAEDICPVCKWCIDCDPLPRCTNCNMGWDCCNCDNSSAECPVCDVTDDDLCRICGFCEECDLEDGNERCTECNFGEDCCRFFGCGADE